MTDTHFRSFDPSDIDWLVEQHQHLYASSEGFDATFGPLVRKILTEFSLDHDPTCEAGWIAMRGTEPLGSIFCVRFDDTTAKLRLFFLRPEARGSGLGQRLLDQCLTFARGAGYSSMTLWTHESHLAACALYAKNGFSLVSSKPVHSFGVDLVEQTWTRAL